MDGLGIQVRGLTVRYGSTVALDGVDLDVRPGAITGLLGRNGSGKTTLASVVASFRRPNGGTVLVDGEDPWENERLAPHVLLVRESGDVMDDDLLNGMGDAALGAVTAHIYSAAHPSQLNKEFVAAYKKEFGTRPGFMAVGGYDGIHLVYEALKKTGGNADGEKLVEAMKGMKWESPRGPISIDPETRDIVQNVYIRKVARVDGELYNVEFATFEAVKDPGKTKK